MTAAAITTFTGLMIKPRRVFAAWPKESFDITDLSQSIKSVYGHNNLEENSKVKLKEVRKFLEDHAASIELEFFRVDDDGDDTVGTSKLTSFIDFEGYNDVVDDDTVLDTDDTVLDTDDQQPDEQTVPRYVDFDSTAANIWLLKFFNMVMQAA